MLSHLTMAFEVQARDSPNRAIPTIAISTRIGLENETYSEKRFPNIISVLSSVWFGRDGIKTSAAIQIKIDLFVELGI